MKAKQKNTAFFRISPCQRNGSLLDEPVSAYYAGNAEKKKIAKKMQQICNTQLLAQPCASVEKRAVENLWIMWKTLRRPVNYPLILWKILAWAVNYRCGTP